MSMGQAALLLVKQLKEITQGSGSASFSCGFKDDDNPFVWDVTIYGPPGTPYESGLFRAEMTFPQDYPNQPPKLVFTSDIWHPNIYTDGKVCISILHAPGEDVHGYESAEERWRPIHSAESVLISVTSMLADPNIESPANVDAAKEFRDDKAAFDKKVKRCARRSVDDM
mmetsp:Transcript_30501/g.83597  ORF Transcript_30501/g.83597 Transcript_30501/m.83597 type:complete len:169 (+) Transcript_30501:84-590(+)